VISLGVHSPASPPTILKMRSDRRCRNCKLCKPLIDIDLCRRRKRDGRSLGMTRRDDPIGAVLTKAKSSCSPSMPLA
jgi:hypothetical protein